MVTEWPRLANGGLDMLAELIDTDDYKVVITDTLGRVRVPRGGRDSYQEDSDALSILHDLVQQRPASPCSLFTTIARMTTPTSTSTPSRAPPESVE